MKLYLIVKHYWRAKCRYFMGKSRRPFVKDRTPLEHAGTGTTHIMSHFFNAPDLSSDTPAS
jgi:hypothetical protein